MLRPLSFALAAAALIAASAPASATYVCDVQRTADGFVALRAAPSAQSALLARMQPGQMVRLGNRDSGAWREVIYWTGGDVPIETEARFRQGLRGWVHGRLIGDCG
jgi:hypothetical protein